jgi:hypothetical protein
MPRKRLTPEEIITKLRQVDVLVREGNASLNRWVLAVRSPDRTPAVRSFAPH